MYFADFSDDILLQEVLIGARSEVSTEQVKAALGTLSQRVQVAKLAPCNKDFKLIKADEQKW